MDTTTFEEARSESLSQELCRSVTTRPAITATKEANDTESARDPLPEVPGPLLPLPGLLVVLKVLVIWDRVAMLGIAVTVATPGGPGAGEKLIPIGLRIMSWRRQSDPKAVQGETQDGRGQKLGYTKPL